MSFTKIFGCSKNKLHKLSLAKNHPIPHHLQYFNYRKTMTTTTWKPEEHIPEEIQESFKNLSSSPSAYVISLLSVVEQLKIQRRTGWVDHNVSPCESISDHMYRMGIAAMLLKTPGVDKAKCTQIALVHDIAESLVGDITPFDPIDKQEKHRRELATIEYLCEKLIKPYNEVAAKEIHENWLAYENISSIEARFVKDLDKFEMLCQCFEYEKRSNGTVDFTSFWSAAASIKTEEVTEWKNELYRQREAFFKSLEESK